MQTIYWKSCAVIWLHTESHAWFRIKEWFFWVVGDISGRWTHLLWCPLFHWSCGHIKEKLSPSLSAGMLFACTVLCSWTEKAEEGVALYVGCLCLFAALCRWFFCYVFTLNPLWWQAALVFLLYNTTVVVGWCLCGLMGFHSSLSSWVCVRKQHTNLFVWGLTTKSHWAAVNDWHGMLLTSEGCCFMQNASWLFFFYCMD